MTEKADETPYTRIPSATDKYPDLFRDIDAIIEQLHNWIDLGNIREDDTFVGKAKTGVLFRAYNQYRAIANLLKTDHWEDALILTRSLFELLLNVEELLRHREDVEEAAERFVRFSELQEYLSWSEMEMFYVVTGESSLDIKAKIDKMDAKARIAYSMFWHTDKKGRSKWRTSWCNKAVSELCEASENEARRHQYRAMYARASQFAHSSPAAVIGTMIPLDQAPSAKEFARLAESQEERETRLIGVVASTLVLDLLRLTGNYMPKYDETWVEGARAEMISRNYSIKVLLRAPEGFYEDSR